jgi:hypothetical protein
MKILRRSLLALAVGCATAGALLLAAPTTPARDTEPRLIRFGYGLNGQSHQGRAVSFFAEGVVKASGAADVRMDFWNETQLQLTTPRGGK